jgi:hypothetical protein
MKQKPKLSKPPQSYATLILGMFTTFLFLIAIA